VLSVRALHNTPRSERTSFTQLTPRLAAHDTQVLRSSREEVQGLKVVVQTLKNTSVSGASEEAARQLEEERAKVREAQLHVHGLTQSFDALLSEMERLKQDSGAGQDSDAVHHPELVRPLSALGGPEPSFAVAVARVVLQGYSQQQAEAALMSIGRNDAAAAVGHLRAQGALPEVDPPTAARLGFASRVESPYPTGNVMFPKGRPHLAASAAAWPGQVKPRPWKGDLFLARARAADMLVTLTSAAFSVSSDTEDRARESCLRALTAQKVLVNRQVPARLLLNAGALEHTAQALSAHRRDPEIVCAAAAVLRELTANSHSAAQCLQQPQHLGAATVAACSALKANPGNIAVGIHCAGLLWGLVTIGGSQLQDAAVNGGVQQHLLELLNCYPEQRELVWRCTGALLAFALRNANTQEVLTNWGVQAAVRSALARDPTLTYGGEFSELRPWMKITGPSGPPPIPTTEPDLARPGRQARDANPRGRRGGPGAPPARPAKMQGGATAAWPPAPQGSDEDFTEEEDDGGDYVAVQTHDAYGSVVPPFQPRGVNASSQVSNAARNAGLSVAQPPSYLTRNTAGDGDTDARIVNRIPVAMSAPSAVAAPAVPGSDVGSGAYSDGLTAQLAATAPLRYVVYPPIAQEPDDTGSVAEMEAVQRMLQQQQAGGSSAAAWQEPAVPAARTIPSAPSQRLRFQASAAVPPARSGVSGASTREGSVRDVTTDASSFDDYDEEEEYDSEQKRSEVEGDRYMAQTLAQQQEQQQAPVPMPAPVATAPVREASRGRVPTAPPRGPRSIASSVATLPSMDDQQAAAQAQAAAEAAAVRERLRMQQAAAAEAAAQAEAAAHAEAEERARRAAELAEARAHVDAESERRRQAEEARRVAREQHLRSVIEAERKAIEAEERAAALERAAEAQARTLEAEERAAAAMAADAERRERRAAAASAMATAQERAARATAAVNVERARAAQVAAAAAEKAEAEEMRAREEAAKAEEKRKFAAEQAAEARARAQARAEEAAIRERQRLAAAAARAAAAAVERAQGLSDAQPPAMPAPAPVVERQQPVQIPAPEEPSGSGDAVDRALGVLALSTASAESVSGALRTLTAACGTGQAAYVVASGGLTSVVSSMRRHSNNPAVLADACLVLGVVTHESDAAEGALGQSPCNDGEAVSALCAAMIAFPKVAALQATASWALWGVVRGNEGNAKRAVVCKGPASLVAAIGTHADSAEVGQSASGALLAIASTGQVGQEAVADARGVAAVKLAMKTHSSIKFRGEFDGLREWLKAEGKRQ